MSGLLLIVGRPLVRNGLKAARHLKGKNVCVSSVHVQNERYNSRVSNTNSNDEEAINDKPVSYTKSKAYEYKASQTFRTKEEEITYVWYTVPIVKLSLAIFMVYFMFLREENDVDETLGKGLFETVPDIQLPMYEAEVIRLERLGADTTELKEKIHQLKQLAD